MKKSDSKVYRADALMLVTAVIWGSGFVAQRVGMDHVGPFAFNGIRFALGALVLLPLIRFRQKSEARSNRSFLWGGGIAGLFSTHPPTQERIARLRGIASGIE